jgi:hypothetical protein
MSRPSDWWILDLGRDPTPGDPGDIRSLARQVRLVAQDARRAERDVRSLAGDGAVTTWLGLAGEVFRGALEDFPKQLDQLADSYELCDSALSSFAGELHTAQDQADRALEQGRAAQAEIDSLQAELSSARSTASSSSRTATDLGAAPAPGAEPPDPAQVRAATRNAQAAAGRVSSLSSSLGGAQDRLEAAKKMAREAEDLRNDAGDRAKSRLYDASDAGIQPKSRWERFKDGAAKLWDATISIAKIVVAVLGIVVLIIGGPLAWVVVGLSLLVLADALMKVRNGEGGWLDVAVAALGLIPGTRGLTSLGALKNAWAGGRVLGVARHLGGRGAELFRGAQAAWQGRRALPIMMRQLPGTAHARIANMAADLRHGVPGAMRGFYAGFAEGSGIIGRTRSGFVWTGVGFNHFKRTFQTAALAGGDPVYAARHFQGRGAYLGVDDWRATTIGPGTQRGSAFEAGRPGLSGFAVPRGTMDDLGRDAARYNESIQVGPGASDGPYNPYRPEGVRLEAVREIPAAESVARANPQYGAGGGDQVYIPDLPGRMRDGDVIALGPDGSRLPVTVRHDGKITVQAPDGSFIDMTNYGPNPNVFTVPEFEGVQRGLRDVYDIGRIGIGIPARAERMDD